MKTNGQRRRGKIRRIREGEGGGVAGCGVKCEAGGVKVGQGARSREGGRRLLIIKRYRL